MSIILHDILSNCINSIRSSAGIREKLESVLCDLIQDWEGHYIASLATWIVTPEFLEVFRKGHALFCYAHFLKLLAHIVDRGVRGILLDTQIEKMEKLSKKLESFIIKADYRVKERATRDEAEARHLTAEILRGLDV